MKSVVFLGLLLLFVGNKPLQAQQNEKAFLIGEIIDKAETQRMLTLKMSKAHVSMYLGVQAAESKAELDQSVLHFEQQLVDFRNISLRGRYKQLLNKAIAQWESFKKTVTRRPSKSSIEELLSSNKTITQSFDAVSTELKRVAQKRAGHSDYSKENNEIIKLETLAAKQRVLAQQVLFYYLCNQAIIGESPEIEKALEQTLEHYENALVTLLGAPENTPEIDYRLTLLGREWDKIAASCQKEVTNIGKTEEILALGNKLSTAMDDVTKLYEQIVDFRVASELLNNAVDMAAQQSVLTQKIVRFYIAEGKNSDASMRTNINTLVNQFEYHIDELKLFAPIDEITNSLEVVDGLWTAFRNEAMNESTRAGAARLLDMNNELLLACDNVVLMLEMYAKIYKKSVKKYDSEIAHLINLIDHQDMLAERILMYSYAIAWNVNNDDMVQRLEKVGYEYLDNLNTLNRSFGNNVEIERRKQLVIDKWETAKGMLTQAKDHQEDLMDLASSIATEVHELTNLLRQKVNGIVAEEAIDIADHQSMLSQQIATAYLAIGMGLNVKRHKQQLEKDKLLFQKQLGLLNNYALSPKVRETLNVVNQLWNNYQVAFSSKISKEGAAKLLKESKGILKACEAVAQAIEAESPSEQVKVVNQAAHLRTMVEEVQLYYLAERWGIQASEGKIEQTMKRFQRTVNHLANQNNTSEKIKQLLSSINTYQERFEERCGNIKEVDLYSILTLHNVLLLETEKLTKAYEQELVF